MELEEIKDGFTDRPLTIYQLLVSMALYPKDRLKLYHELRYYEASGDMIITKTKSGKTLYFPNMQK